MISSALGLDRGDLRSSLRTGFLKWQCRVRQIAMREREGMPDDAIMPEVALDGDAEPLGSIITVLCKAPVYSVTPELRHIAARTNDPAHRRQKAIQFLSAGHYQKAREFSDTLTATFSPGSMGAMKIRAAGKCRLFFDAYAQRFDLTCNVWRLQPHDYLYKATIAHNVLFNPSLPAGTEVLGFDVAWSESGSEPPM
ncbi:MAG: hypothetical protein OXD29_09365 [Roseovarius sp.]|nr:hypothetical protein [Roseovarius sp.]MCY4314538.1 hypothetical protein [Roseovarius sp.]